MYKKKQGSKVKTLMLLWQNGATLSKSYHPTAPDPSISSRQCPPCILLSSFPPILALSQRGPCAHPLLLATRCAGRTISVTIAIAQGLCICQGFYSHKRNKQNTKQEQDTTHPLP